MFPNQRSSPGVAADHVHAVQPWPENLRVGAPVRIPDFRNISTAAKWRKVRICLSCTRRNPIFRSRQFPRRLQIRAPRQVCVDFSNGRPSRTEPFRIPSRSQLWKHGPQRHQAATADPPKPKRCQHYPLARAATSRFEAPRFLGREKADSRVLAAGQYSCLLKPVAAEVRVAVKVVCSVERGDVLISHPLLRKAYFQETADSPR